MVSITPVLLAAAALAACGAVPVGQADPQQYVKDESWPAHAVDTHIGGVVVGESFVWLGQRNASLPPIVRLEKSSGKLLQSCTFNATVGDPHNIGSGHLANELWVADIGRHQILRVSCGPGDGDGKTLEMIGVPDVGGSSLDPLQFDSVADMDGSGRGPLYVVDGDGGANNELLKLDGQSRAVVAHSGTAGGVFNIPHNVVHDTGTNRVWVADRANMRLQVFSADDLTLLAVWDCSKMGAGGVGRSPYGLALMPAGPKLAISYVEPGPDGMGGVMFFPDVTVSAAAIASAAPIDAFTTGNDTLPHGVAGDPDGKGGIYVAYITAARVERWLSLPL